MTKIWDFPIFLPTLSNSKKFPSKPISKISKVLWRNGSVSLISAILRPLSLQVSELRSNFGSPDPFSSSRPKNGSELKTDFAEKFNDFPGSQFSRVQQSICDMANVVRGPEVQIKCHTRPRRTLQLLTSRTVSRLRYPDANKPPTAHNSQPRY